MNDKESLDPVDWESTRSVGHSMIDDMIEHIKTIRDRPVWKEMNPADRLYFSDGPPLKERPIEEVYADFKSKILQMPFEKVAGKYAYPDEIKINLFKGLYNALNDWHEKVFFYLCMEPEKLWQPVFGVPDYADNAAFEHAMKQAYTRKIESIR